MRRVSKCSPSLQCTIYFQRDIEQKQKFNVVFCGVSCADKTMHAHLPRNIPDSTDSKFVNCGNPSCLVTAMGPLNGGLGQFGRGQYT